MQQGRQGDRQTVATVEQKRESNCLVTYLYDIHCVLIGNLRERDFNARISDGLPLL